ncbi:MAG: hypothetical protein V4482_06900 [Pseudomonadota bacterium]
MNKTFKYTCVVSAILGSSIANGVSAAELAIGESIHAATPRIQIFPHDAYINADGAVIDPKTCSILDILRETHNDYIPSDNNAAGIEGFCQTYLFKNALYFDQLRDHGETTEIPTQDQARRILAVLDQDGGANIMPVLPPESNLTLVVTMGLVTPTISLRIADVRRAYDELTHAGHTIDRIALSIPCDIKPEILGYLNELVETQLTGLHVEQFFSTDLKNHNESNMQAISQTLSETYHVLVLTDKTFYDKMSLVCASFGDRYLGAAYYYLSEGEKATHYGYDISTELGLRNWVGNGLNFAVARNFHNHFESWKKVNNATA